MTFTLVTKKGEEEVAQSNMEEREKQLKQKREKYTIIFPNGDRVIREPIEITKTTEIDAKKDN